MNERNGQDTDFFSDLGILAQNLRKSITDMRHDPELLSKIGRLRELPDTWGETLLEKIDWYTGYTSRVLERFKIPEMVFAYKRTSKETQVPSNAKEFIDGVNAAPDWLKRRLGIRNIIAFDLKEMSESKDIREKAVADWVYLMIEYIDVIENQKSVKLGDPESFKRYMREYPLESEGWNPSMYDLVAFYIPALVTEHDPDKINDYLDTVKGVVERSPKRFSKN
jgi:hypothetical protein